MSEQPKSVQSEKEHARGLAITALVLGVIAIVGSWVPFFNVFSMVLGVLSIVFGAIGLIIKLSKKDKSLALVIAGIALGILTIVIAVNMNKGASDAISDAVDEISNGSQELQEVANKKYTVGDEITFDGKTIGVTKVARNWSSGSSYIKPDSGKEYVLVEVKYINNTDKDLSYNALDWRIVDSAGDITSYAWVSTDNDLNSGQLLPGGTKTGNIVFEVAKNDTSLATRFNDSWLSSTTITIDL